MKKLFVYAGIACAAALSLTNCSKIEPQTPSSEGMPFEIVASTAETKTANDGLKTTWVEGDALNLFHAETGSTTDYGTNDEFTFVSRENFSGTLTEPLDASKNYDWYALYPYNKSITTPGVRDKGYVYVGGRSDQSQIQTGNDSKAHLIYNEEGNGLKNCPLYAVLKNVSASDKPAFQMKHLSSVVAVKVTNNSGNPLTVSKVAFSAPEGTTIVGAYLVDITGDTPDYSKIYNNYASNVANLTVNEGADIANGASATFYLAVKPFKAAANTLKIAVNGYEKTPTATKDVEFKAGHIATVNFNYDKKETAVTGTTVTKSIADLFSGKDNATKISSIALNDVITLSASGGTNTGKYYTSNNSWRLYQNESATLTISAKTGYVLKSATITFTATKSGNLNYNSNTISSDEAVKLSGDSAIFTVGGTGKNGQIQITSISVTYE